MQHIEYYKSNRTNILVHLSLLYIKIMKVKETRFYNRDIVDQINDYIPFYKYLNVDILQFKRFEHVKIILRTSYLRTVFLKNLI